jgi:hypothetical protein
MKIHGETPAPIAIEQAPPARADKQVIDAPTRDRWMSDLAEWGKQTKRRPAFLSTEQAHELVERLVAANAAAHRPERTDRAFCKMENRIHWNGKQRIDWLWKELHRVEKNPDDSSIPNSRRGRPDLIAGRIEDYLRTVHHAHKNDIVALGIKPTTAKTTLSSMKRNGRVVSYARGFYALPQPGIVARVPTEEAILAVLAEGPASPDEIRARTGKTVGEIAGGLHRLKKADKIVPTKRGRYALAGTAPAHVYARDAIEDALYSGEKTEPELIAATGKKRHEIHAALYRLRDEGNVEGVAKRGYFVVWALTTRRRRQLTAQRRRQPAKRPAHDGVHPDLFS